MEIWTRNGKQSSKINVGEISYLRGASSVNRMDSKRNESVYRRLGMSSNAEGRNYGVMKLGTCGTLKWFDHLERTRVNTMTKRVYMSKVCR